MKNALLAFVVAAVASGHHGWAAFDPQLSVTFKAKVTDFHFVNPHSVVEFDVKDDSGQVQNWQGELTSAARLGPKGWTATTIEAGAELTITGYRARSGSRVIRIMKILSSDGKELKIEMGN